jgi:glycosyltransferase involved in cell wall biosynthesis
MKILLLGQGFDPEPGFKGLSFARELVARGHEVEVLTGFPNYPGGQVYPGYRIRPWAREQIEGIAILRVALYPSHNKSALGRIINYASFAVSAAFIGTALIKKPDVLYVYCPPATIGLPAVALSILRNVPYVIDICDLWPDTVKASGMLSSPVALWLLGEWCKFVYRCADHIVVVSPGFKHRLVSRGVPPAKIDLVHNWCDETSIHPTPPNPELATRLGLSGAFNVMFAGMMGTAQALDSVLLAAAMCRHTLPNAQFVFVGGGVDRDRLKEKAEAMGLTNTRFLPRQPMSAMGDIIALADLLLVHLKDDPLFRITIPSKTQAYMASGKPILMAVRGDAAQLVTESGAGLVCEPENPADIAEAVARFAAMSPEERRIMGQAGRQFYIEQLSLKLGVNKFEKIFSRIR